ncbi:DUF4974 domain-containing protein [Emticicia sp. CRIBPO]|uniref:FecR family protein n=1 Tax=Emticicia sp. CRIBPO TaxID=2683258 RepID=UPI001412CAAA|nr:FecR domain-containing protein [Emticicia sp. CRIBPO]NBA88210.1 DUF4974 domain-containing protein [Emticicia sp. CRIBPO]
MDYSGFDVDDFIFDKAFTEWVRTGENDAFWQDLMQSQPLVSHKIEEAREIILAAASLPQAMLSAQEKQEILQNIHQRIEEEEVVEDQPVVLTVFRKMWWAAAAVIIVAGWLTWKGTGSHSKEVTYEKLVAAEVKSTELQESVNTAEKPLLVNLPDGSSVLLLKGGKLSFNKANFNNTRREVYLSGEAFFEVSKNPEKPFFVYANELVTKVLGTSFTIRAFNDSKNVEVVVKTGKVSVFTQRDPGKEDKMKDNKLEGLVLLPNQQIVLERSQMKLSKSGIERPELLTLPAQKLSFEFDDVPFAEVAATMERSYGVEIIFDKELLGKCRLTAYLSDEPLNDKIRMICDALSATSEVADKKIFIKANACK